MSRMIVVENRYHTDPDFRALVESLYAWMTARPSQSAIDLRDAASMAGALEVQARSQPSSPQKAADE